VARNSEQPRQMSNLTITRAQGTGMNEWYTPSGVIENRSGDARAASTSTRLRSEAAQESVKAVQFFTKKDGNSHLLHARVGSRFSHHPARRPAHRLRGKRSFTSGRKWSGSAPWFFPTRRRPNARRPWQPAPLAPRGGARVTRLSSRFFLLSAATWAKKCPTQRRKPQGTTLGGPRLCLPPKRVM